MNTWSPMSWKSISGLFPVLWYRPKRSSDCQPSRCGFQASLVQVNHIPENLYRIFWPIKWHVTRKVTNAVLQNSLMKAKSVMRLSVPILARLLAIMPMSSYLTSTVKPVPMMTAIRFWNVFYACLTSIRVLVLTIHILYMERHLSQKGYERFKQAFEESSGIVMARKNVTAISSIGMMSKPQFPNPQLISRSCA